MSPLTWFWRFPDPGSIIIFHHHLVAWDGGRAGGEAEVPHEVPHPGGVQLNIPRVARPSTGRLAVDARDARQ